MLGRSGLFDRYSTDTPCRRLSACSSRGLLEFCSRGVGSALKRGAAVSSAVGSLCLYLLLTAWAEGSAGHEGNCSGTGVRRHREEKNGALALDPLASGLATGAQVVDAVDGAAALLGAWVYGRPLFEAKMFLDSITKSDYLNPYPVLLTQS